jgi:plastocyanin
MRRVLLGIVLALGLVFVAPATTATSATATVQITKTGFVPASVTINAGDSVTWKNADKVNHQVVANGGQFASPILSPGEMYTHKFNSGGTFRYHDALHTGLKGTIVVKGPPPQVTLVASSAAVKYGTQVTLTGTVSSKKAGETVTLVQLPYGETTKQVVATLQTTTGGAFSFTVTPQIYTQYQAQWKNLSESSVFIQVAPMIKLLWNSRTGYFHFYVLAGTSFAGKYAFLQRFTLSHQWINIARLVLGSKSGRLLTVRSVQRLLPRGRWSVRVLFPADQAGGGYVDGASGSQPVRRS